MGKILIEINKLKNFKNTFNYKKKKEKFIENKDNILQNIMNKVSDNIDNILFVNNGIEYFLENNLEKINKDYNGFLDNKKEVSYDYIKIPKLNKNVNKVLKINKVKQKSFNENMIKGLKKIKNKKRNEKGIKIINKKYERKKENAEYLNNIKFLKKDFLKENVEKENINYNLLLKEKEYRINKNKANKLHNMFINFNIS